jgi:hypothetical protein
MFSVPSGASPVIVLVARKVTPENSWSWLKLK